MSSASAVVGVPVVASAADRLSVDATARVAPRTTTTTTSTPRSTTIVTVIEHARVSHAAVDEHESESERAKMASRRSHQLIAEIHGAHEANGEEPARVLSNVRIRQRPTEPPGEAQFAPGVRV